MNILLWLTVGGLTGLIVTLIIRTERRATLFRNIVVGALAGLVSSWMIVPYTGQPDVLSAGDVLPSLTSMAIASVGALVVVLILQLARRKEERRMRHETHAH